MKKNWISYFFMAVIVLFALLLNGCGKKEEAPVVSVLVKTQQIQLGGNGDSATYAGEVRGRYESQLAFQVGGKIIARNVELGSAVRAGDTLFEIDTKDLVQAVNSSAAQVASAQAQLRLAEANLGRYRQLYAQSAISAAQYEQYQTNYDAALAALKQAKAQHAQGGNALSYSTLTADSDGVISAVNAEIGQVVAAGQSVVTLVKAGAREVEINIPENRLEDMAVNKAVSVKFWALGDLAVDGIVREVSPVADKVARTYKVRIGLLNPPETIKLGMTASVISSNSSQNTAATLPLSAIYQTGDQPQVWVVEGDVVHLRQITVAAFGDNQVLVTAGLADGDIVVVAGVHKLREAQAVRLVAGDGK